MLHQLGCDPLPPEVRMDVQPEDGLVAPSRIMAGSRCEHLVADNLVVCHASVYKTDDPFFRFSYKKTVRKSLQPLQKRLSGGCLGLREAHRLQVQLSPPGRTILLFLFPNYPLLPPVYYTILFDECLKCYNGEYQSQARKLGAGL